MICSATNYNGIKDFSLQRMIGHDRKTENVNDKSVVLSTAKRFHCDDCVSTNSAIVDVSTSLGPYPSASTQTFTHCGGTFD